METNKGRKPHLTIVVMQRQAPTPSHHCFSAGTNLQEAPTSILQATTCKEAPTPFNFSAGSNLSQLQLTVIKLQLDREAPTSSIFHKKCLLIYLRYQLCSVASLSAPLFLIFSASIFYIFHSLSLLSLKLYAYQDDITYRYFLMTVCIPQGILK